MGTWKSTACAIGAAIFALSISPAFAAVVWQLNPNNSNAPVGSTTKTYSNQGFNITATGYDNNNGIGTPTQLFFKSEQPINAGAEIGLGVVNQNDHELAAGSSPSNPFDFIQFDLSSIIKAGATSGSISVASVQSGESFSIFGSNIAGSLGSPLGGTFGSNKDDVFVNLPNFGQFNFYSIAAVSGDVLPAAVSAAFPQVPEMNALLPIAALLGVVAAFELARRRRFARA